MHSPQASCQYLPIHYLVDSAESNNNCDYRNNNVYYAGCAQEDRSRCRYFKQERFNAGNELLIKIWGKLG